MYLISLFKICIKILKLNTLFTLLGIKKQSFSFSLISCFIIDDFLHLSFCLYFIFHSFSQCNFSTKPS